jgi:hypothetical protein
LLLENISYQLTAAIRILSSSNLRWTSGEQEHRACDELRFDARIKKPGTRVIQVVRCEQISVEFSRDTSFQNASEIFEWNSRIRQARARKYKQEAVNLPDPGQHVERLACRDYRSSAVVPISPEYCLGAA